MTIYFVDCLSRCFGTSSSSPATGSTGPLPSVAAADDLPILPHVASRVRSSVPDIVLLSCRGIDWAPPLCRGRRQPFPPPSARRPTVPYRARVREEVTSIHRVWPACSRQSRSEFPVLAGVDSTSVGVDFFCSVSRLLDFQHAPPASSARCELVYCSFAD
jgi:hypothetical protein